MTTTPTAPGPISGNVLFYSTPEPLSFETHGKLGVNRVDNPFAFAKAGHAIPLTVGEFAFASVSGPIIFVGDERLPIAVMGLNAGDNMFVEPTGLFSVGVYIPAYIRRYPFVYASDDTNQQMILCIDRGAEIIAEGADVPFFTADGQLTEYTKGCLDFCNNFEQERQRTMAFVELLKEYDLFEPKEATFTPTDANGVQGPPQKIADYFGVSEDKLNALPHADFIKLRDNGALSQIYAHLVSLIGWDRLIAMALARANTPPAAANS